MIWLYFCIFILLVLSGEWRASSWWLLRYWFVIRVASPPGGMILLRSNLNSGSGYCFVLSLVFRCHSYLFQYIYILVFFRLSFLALLFVFRHFSLSPYLLACVLYVVPGVCSKMAWQCVCSSHLTVLSTRRQPAHAMSALILPPREILAL